MSRLRARTSEVPLKATLTSRSASLLVFCVGTLGTPFACAGDGGNAPPFRAPVPSLATSTIAVSVPSLTADGVGTTVVTVTLKDSLGSPIGRSAGAVTMHASIGSLSGVTDHRDGTYSATFTAPTSVGTASFTATLDGRPLGSAASVLLRGGVVDPAHSLVRAADSVIFLKGAASTTVHVSVRDAFGNPTDEGVGQVTLATTLGSLGDVARTSVGEYSATLTTTAAGIATITAAIDARPIQPNAVVRSANYFWTARASLPAPRQVLVVGEHGGIIYAVGGGGWTVDSYSTTVETYDPVADSWTSKAPMPTARGELAGAFVNGIFYAVGGYADTDLNTVEAYDPSTDSWSTKAPMPTAREGLAVGVVNGILYAVGGNARGAHAQTVNYHISNVPSGGIGTRANIQTSEHVRNTVEAYDPATNTWTTKAPMLHARSQLAVGVVDGILYAVGGRFGNDGSSAVDAYDPATDTWSSKTALPESSGRGALAVAVMDGKLYAVGGYIGYSETDIVDAYDPSTNRWTSVAPMRTMRQSLGAAVVAGVLYAIGGACYDDTFAVVEAFTP
jgi:N-acetylneuraminic acid mutarotase